MSNEGVRSEARDGRTRPLNSGREIQLGAYETRDGLRELWALEIDDRLCVIDRDPAGALLVEPDLTDLAEVRALAADYLAVAGASGEPQSTHVFEPRNGDERRSGSRRA